MLVVTKNLNEDDKVVFFNKNKLLSNLVELNVDCCGKRECG